MPIDTDCAEHTGYDFEQSHFSELDNDSKHRGIEYPCQVARLRASIMTAFNTTPLMHLTRRRKVAFSLAVVVTVLLFFATLHRFGFDRSWARLSSSVTHSGPNEAFGKPKPSDPEPTICSSWPDVQAPIISRTDDASHHKEAEAINRGRKWTKPAGFKIVAVIFCKSLLHNSGITASEQC